MKLELDRKKRRTFQVCVSLFEFLLSLGCFLVYLVLNSSDGLTIVFWVDEVCDAADVLAGQQWVVRSDLVQKMGAYVHNLMKGVEGHFPHTQAGV